MLMVHGNHDGDGLDGDNHDGNFDGDVPDRDDFIPLFYRSTYP